MKSNKLTTHKGLPLVLQQGTFGEFPESARHYLMDSWVRQHSNFFPRGEGLSSIRDRLRRRATNILKLPSTFVTMALFPDAAAKHGEERIIGWTVWSLSRVIHYLYVRSVYRQGGAGKALLCSVARGSDTLAATHWSKDLPKWGDIAFPGLIVEYVGFDALNLPQAMGAEAKAA